MKYFFALAILFTINAQANKTEVLRTLDCKGSITLADGSNQVLAVKITDTKEIFNLGGQDEELFSSSLVMADPVGVNKTLLGTVNTDSDSQNTRDAKNEGGWKGTLFYSLAKTEADLENDNFLGVLGLISAQNQINLNTRTYEVGLRIFGTDENGTDDVDLSGTMTCTVQ